MTPKDYDTRPETRVFRLDTECYIIYLGRNGNDYRPFLRIGNTANLPQQVIANTYSIVITDRLTGNPAFETANISDMDLEEIRYLGDPDLVERFKTFVRKANLHAEGFEEYHGDEEPMPDGSFVYFHTDGNMTVYYGRNKIFDLRERERRDEHFIEQAKRIRSQYIKNQLRYREEDLKNPGFILLNGRAVLYRGGRIVVPELPPDFFESFTKAGIDPDLVEAVMDDALTESLSHLFKRKRSKQDAVVVVTKDVPLITTAADLFSVKKQEALAARMVDFTSGECNLDGLSLRRVEGWLRARFDELDLELLVPQSAGASTSRTEAAAAIALNPPRHELTFNQGRRSDRVEVLPNTPIMVTHGGADPARLADRVFRSTNGFYSAVMPQETYSVIEQLNEAMAAIAVGNDAGRLRQVESRLRDVPPDASAYLRPYLIGVESFLRMAANGEFGLTVDRSVGSAASGVAKMLRGIETQTTPRYLCGQLVIGEGGLYLFYYPAKSNVTPNIIERSAVISSKIEEELFDNSELFESERERLLELIAQLNIPTSRRRSTRENSEDDAAASQTAASGDTATRGSEQPAASAAADAGKGAATTQKEPTAARSAADERTSRGASSREPAARPRPAPSRRDAGTPARDLSSVDVMSRPRRGRSRGSFWGRFGIAAAVLVLLAALVFALFRFLPGLRRNQPIASNETNAESGRTPGAQSGQPGQNQAGQQGQPAQIAQQGQESTGQQAESGQAGESAQSGRPARSGEPAPGGGQAGSQRQASPTGQSGQSGQTTAPGRTAPGSAAGQANASQPQGPAQSQGSTQTQGGAQQGQQSQTTRAGGSAQSGPSSQTPGSGAAGTTVNGASPEAGRQPGAQSQPGSSAAREIQNLADHLNIDGVQVTVLDLINLTNYIATHNGFRAMGDPNPSDGRNPNLIYPGDGFTLPDGTRYVARLHDAIWYIAADYLRAQLTDRMAKYRALLNQYGNPPSTDASRKELIAKLQDLESGSFSENFVRMIDAKISSLQSSAP